MIGTVLRFFLIIFYFILLFGMAMMQFSANLKDNSDSDSRKTWFLSFVENRLSGRGQKINISDIDGIFASHVSIKLITVADKKGIWLKINNVKLDWNRMALLAGRVSIDSLCAERIEVLRRPVLEISTPKIMAGDLALPTLPTTLTVNLLKFQQILFDKQLFGQEEVASIDGYLICSKGVFSFKLDMKRLEDSNSLSKPAVKHVNDKLLTCEHGIFKPKNGFDFNLLKIENQPSINLSILGKGTFDKLDIKASMEIANCSVLNILFKLNTGKDGMMFNLTMNGPISMVMPEIYRPIFGWNTKFNADGILTFAGGLRLNRFFLEGSCIRISGQIEITPDGFLRQLLVDVLIALEESQPSAPVHDEKTMVKEVAFNLAYGMPETDIWTGTLVMHNLTTENFHADDIVFSMGGPAENLDDPTRRHVGMVVRGMINGITTSRSDIANVIGTHISIPDLVMSIGNGSITVDGIIADTVNLVIHIKNVPLQVTNLIWPEADPNGIVIGVSNVIDNRNPSIDSAISASGAARSLKREGIDLYDVKACGKTVWQIPNIPFFDSRSDVGAQGRGRISAARQKKDTQHSALSSIVKDQIINDSITISLWISSIFTNPVIRFFIEGKNLTSKWLTDSGLAPVYFSSTGFYSDNILNFNELYLTDANSLNMKISGCFSLSGYESDFKIDGSVPLALANYFLVDRGLQLSGLLTLHAMVRGNLDTPHLDGTFSIANGQFTDPELNVWLNAITIFGKFCEDQLFIEQSSAISANGGSLSLSGQISTNVIQGFPANLALSLNHTRYTNGKILIMISHGKATVFGPLMRNPIISGGIYVEKAEIDIPENFGNAAPIDVKHRYSTASIVKTLERARMKTRHINTLAAAHSLFVPELDLQIKAENRVFVRGRGLDVELGGQLHLVGPLTDVHPIGGFNMIHGQFDVLARRLNLREGQVTMAGNMNPELYFVATADVDDINLAVEVSGMPQNLKLSFTSQPTLPQDEILSRLIFKRSIRELSPFQVVQLVDATAELIGIRNKSLFSSLRSGMGLDKLNFVTDAFGNTGVEAGRYIQNNFYLGVETVTGGTSRGTVNLNINHSLKAKAAVGSDSNSNAGVFYEKDY